MKKLTRAGSVYQAPQRKFATSTHFQPVNLNKKEKSENTLTQKWEIGIMTLNGIYERNILFNGMKAVIDVQRFFSKGGQSIMFRIIKKYHHRS